ncbi:MAG: RND transporter [Bacteroidetes bacterium]|nr:MAG: RND transporter [Bacteroidota bacterium]
MGKYILKNKWVLMAILLVATCFMAYKTTQIELSYDFARAVPLDNQKYIDYQAFKQKFGNDGNMMVAGFDNQQMFTVNEFNALHNLQEQLKAIPGITSVFSVADAVSLHFNDSTQKIETRKIFPFPLASQGALDSAKLLFENLPFYKGLLHQPQTHSYVMAISLNKDSINSKARNGLVYAIKQKIQVYEQAQKTTVRLSGLPFIRTAIAEKITHEMNYFLLGSLLLSAITLLLFFRSVLAMFLSLLVVALGVVFSLGTMVILGFKITLLTALIPPLIVVIGVPNCIYFLNKYHTSYLEIGQKQQALVNMIGKMGIVTLFCNIAAAIGFAVFALTTSTLLIEFGIVAGINIMVLFYISLILIPSVLSIAPVPKPREMKYLTARWMTYCIEKIEVIALQNQRWVYAITIITVLGAGWGVTKLRSEAFIVDDLPKQDRIYADLKWFESNFGGVMPLEIMVDTKKKNGLLKTLKPLEKIDELSTYIEANDATARPMSLVEALKFAKQAYYDNDTSNYAVPTEFDIPVLGQYLKAKSTDSATTENKSKSGFANILNNFMDSSKAAARISVNMKDIGTVALPKLLADFQAKAAEIFDTAKYSVTFTGTSVTFLEGSKYIINGLKESIAYAFLLIALSMLYLFKNVRMVVCSLIPNIVPLFITAGVMGWAGIPLKPSTVLVFSVALGIAIDVTIRFLVNYKQELPLHQNQIATTVRSTIQNTGVSIIYTSLVLVAGFIIFCFSEFGGTRSLGWLTSLTLVVGTLTNMLLLPCLLISLSKKGS